MANFPAGALDAALAVADTRAIVDAGGDEVDVVRLSGAGCKAKQRLVPTLLAQVRRLWGARSL